MIWYQLASTTGLVCQGRYRYNSSQQQEGQFSFNAEDHGGSLESIMVLTMRRYLSEQHLFRDSKIKKRSPIYAID